MTIEETIASCAVRASFDLKAALILAVTHSGKTAQLLAKHKPMCPVLVVTPHEWAAHSILLHKGTFSMTVGSLVNSHIMVQKMMQVAI